MKVTCAVVPARGARFELADAELDEPVADDVRVRVVASGICHTDIAVRGRATGFPVVLGHEGAGVVDAVGPDVRHVRPGDRVVMTYRYCGRCRRCLLGKFAYCDDGVALNFSGTRPGGRTGWTSSDGTALLASFFGQSSFSTYSLASEQNVVPVPGDLPLSLLAPLGCSMQTGAGAILNSLGVPAGASVVVIGAGAVGLAAVIAASLAGAHPVVAVDRVETRLRTAADLGATVVVNADSEDVAARVAAATGGGGDFVLDATGRDGMLGLAVSLSAPLATIGFVGGTQAPANVDLGPLLLGGRTIRGVVQGDSNPQVFIPYLAGLVAQGRFPVGRLIRSYGFDAINEAVADSESGRTIKPVLELADSER